MSCLFSHLLNFFPKNEYSRQECSLPPFSPRPTSPGSPRFPICHLPESFPAQCPRCLRAWAEENGRPPAQASSSWTSMPLPSYGSACLCLPAPYSLPTTTRKHMLSSFCLCFCLAVSLPLSYLSSLWICLLCPLHQLGVKSRYAVLRPLPGPWDEKGRVVTWPSSGPWVPIPAVPCRLCDPQPEPTALWVCFSTCKMDTRTVASS